MEREPTDDGSLVAALRYMQRRSLAQAEIAGDLSEAAAAVMRAIRDELAH